MKELVERIAELNEKEHQMLAFRDPQSGMTDWSKWMVSTYHDELAGGENGSFRYWFVCKAGGKEWPCNTAILDVGAEVRLGRSAQQVEVHRVRCELLDEIRGPRGSA